MKNDFILNGVCMLSSLFSLLTELFSVFLSVSPSQAFPPPLDAKEEHELFIKMKNGDKTARNSLIEHNLRLVSHIVRKYYAASPSPDDLFSIGSIGLVKAIDSFDPSNGARFATYSAKCIQNEILMYFRSQKKLTTEVSINETIDTDRDGNPLTYGDIISSEDNIAEQIDRKIKCERAFEYIKNRLGERERRIIVMRYGLDGKRPLTQREVAERLGISRSYVSRIEKSILTELREYIDGKSLPY